MARERSGLMSIALAVIARIYTRETLLIYRAPVHPGKASQINVDLRYASPETVRDLAWFHTPHELRVFERFLDAGHVGYLGYVDGRCVHRTWYVPGPAEVREHWSQRRAIGHEEGFVHYCLTVEEARGMGVFPAVLAKVARDHSGRRTTMAIALGNNSSQQAALKAGWVPVEVVSFAVYFGIRRQRRRAMPVTTDSR